MWIEYHPNNFININLATEISIGETFAIIVVDGRRYRITDGAEIEKVKKTIGQKRKSHE